MESRKMINYTTLHMQKKAFSTTTDAFTSGLRTPAEGMSNKNSSKGFQSEGTNLLFIHPRCTRAQPFSLSRSNSRR